MELKCDKPSGLSSKSTRYQVQYTRQNRLKYSS